MKKISLFNDSYCSISEDNEISNKLFIDRLHYITHYTKFINYYIKELRCCYIVHDSVLLEGVLCSLYDKSIYSVDKDIFVGELMLHIYKALQDINLCGEKYNNYLRVIQNYLLLNSNIVIEYLSYNEMVLNLICPEQLKITSNVKIIKNTSNVDIINYDIFSNDDRKVLDNYIYKLMK